LKDGRAPPDAVRLSEYLSISLAQPLPAALLPLTPAQYNGGTAGPVLKKARATLVEARGLLQTARKDAQACRGALR
jgi:hypothetical protein